MNGTIGRVNGEKPTTYNAKKIDEEPKDPLIRNLVQKGKEFAISSNTRRQLVNINGSMNVVDSTDLVVDFADMINAQSTTRVLGKLMQRVRSERIYIISENIKYYCYKPLKD